MPKRSRSTQSRKKQHTPVRVKLLLAFLVITLVGGVGLVKYFKSPRGKAFLLERGFTVYYDEVQDAVGKQLLDALEQLRLRDRMKGRIEIKTVGGWKCYYKRWDVPCGDECDLVRVNVALTKAVRRAGLSVREAVEESDGNVLRFDVGTKKHRTHLIFIRKGERISIIDKTARPKLAIVVDDFGYSKNSLIEDIFALDFPLTITIIPSLPHSESIAALASRSGKEILLHLPMEAEEPNDSDVEMVLTSMSNRRIRQLVESYLEQIPGVSGVNNHMGSKATQDERVMRVVLSVLRRRGLFFLDSLTSHKSIAYNTAKSMGVGTARNTIFLDADASDPNIIEERLQRLVSIARQRGRAVGIAHPKRWSLDVLRKSRALCEVSGVQLVFVSELID
ncbi:MAG: hypothetical protein GTO51_02820 [Candidatus Latescibacteria bacterium]|nr:hypothetical protein [Candidatus Latescibacterota bacterium]NIM22616.1 hypothetical protein [Candidatus Latescibacterota bacterium]NIM64905.1 hypothetical protein [Candidatus Latescibacterota bacterium]NIO01420.1 hypothetical protein [Candidatus Latescibacterota bacterium]NIO27930.1 hypothetical protein [Candidatus Latescibacterota bacterium]